MADSRPPRALVAIAIVVVAAVASLAILAWGVAANRSVAAPFDAARPEASAPISVFASADASDPCAGEIAGGDIDGSLLALLLPDYDRATKLVSGPYEAAGENPETFQIRACRGAPRTTEPNDGVVSGQRAQGRVTIARWAVPESAARAAGADEGWVVRVVFGGRLGICGTSEGFEALAFRKGARLRIGAVDAWTGECGPTPPVFLEVAGAFAFVENDSGNDDEGAGDDYAEVRIPRGDTFEVIRGIHTGRTEWRAEGAGAPYTGMSGVVSGDAEGFAVDETWVRSPGADAGAAETKRRKVLYRRAAGVYAPDVTGPVF